MVFPMQVERLIERCKMGDADAASELYTTYAQRMRGVCRRYVKDEHSVDDVLHDAFVIIFTSLDRLRDASKAEAWMMSITRNVASKYKDHMDALPVVPLDEAVNLPIYNEETSVRGIPMEEVMRLIDGLPEGYGKVFRLSVFEGMSHKEIAALLGIEPHSSSSQLYRAKKILRKSLAQYWLLWLIPFLLPVALYLYDKDMATDDKAITSVSEKQTQQNVESQHGNGANRTPSSSSVATPKPILSVVTSPSLTILPDTIQKADTLQYIAEQVVEQKTDSTESSQGIESPSVPLHRPDELIAETEQCSLTPISTPETERWSIDLAYSGDFNKTTNISTPTSLWGQSMTDITSIDGEPSLWEAKTWNEYIGFLYETDLTEEERTMLQEIAESNIANGEDEIRRNSHHDLPSSVSLALRRQLAPRWSVETGLTYTRLSSQFTTGIPQAGFVESQKIHYLGIPLSLNYQWMGSKQWSLYSSVGAMLDIPAGTSLTTDYRLDGMSLKQESGSFHAPLQWSVGMGAGLQYNITPNIGLFAEPRFQYYIPTGTNVETYRTAHPFSITIPVGLRFTW